MTDAELRARLLSHFYNLRHNNGGYVPVSDMIISGTERVTLEAIGDVCGQLGKAGLIEWTGYLGRGPEIGAAKITGLGVDAVETGKSASLEIRFPNAGLRDLPAPLPSIKEPKRIMAASDDISQEGRNTRFETWEKLGVDRVKADLVNGGHQIVGGPPQVQDLAWEWIRMKDANLQSQGVQLARNVELIEALLLRLKDYPSEPGAVVVFSGNEPELAVDGYSTGQILHCLQQLREMGLIDSPGHRTPVGVIFRGLSQKGHHFLEEQRALSANRPKPPVARQGPLSSKIFIVHGHDYEAKAEVARFIERLGFQPIILHEQASQNRTVIEKFEANSDVGFAVVLLTPDDEGSKRGQPAKPRARQNVVLELGYFVGRLGRGKVCALRRGEVEIPSDFNGVVYETYDEHGAWRGKLAKELEAADFPIDWTKVYV